MAAAREKKDSEGGGDDEDVGPKKRAAVATKNHGGSKTKTPATAKKKSAPATIVKMQRSAGTWVCITELERDLNEGEPVEIRSIGGSKTVFDGHSGVAVRNLSGERPAIELDMDAVGHPIQPKQTKNVQKKYIFVQEESP